MDATRKVLRQILKKLQDSSSKHKSEAQVGTMELMQLRMLVAVVEESSIQEAAERVFRTAPAVSMALRKLEVEIGASLFDRIEPREHALIAALTPKVSE